MNKQDYFANHYGGISVDTHGENFNQNWIQATAELNDSLLALSSTLENRRNMARAEQFAREQQASAQSFAQFQQSKADANNDIRSVADAMKQLGLDPLNAQFRGSSTGAAGSTTSPVYPSDHIPQMIALNQQKTKNKMDFLLGLKRLGIDDKQVNAAIDETIKESKRKDRSQANEDAMTLSQIDNLNKQQQLERDKLNTAIDQFNQTMAETVRVNDKSLENRAQELILKAQELQNQKWIEQYRSLSTKEQMSIHQSYQKEIMNLQQEFQKMMDEIEKDWQGDQNSKQRWLEAGKAVVQAIGIIGGLYLGRGAKVLPPAPPTPQAQQTPVPWFVGQ